MLEKSALDRLGNVDAGMISDCMMRLGLAGWMDGVRPIQSGHRRAAGRARTLLFGPKRGEGQWSRSMYRTIASLQPGEILVMASGGTLENLMGDNIAMHDLFVFQQTGVDSERRAVGCFQSTGIRPKCLERLKNLGVDVPPAMFERRILSSPI